MYTTHTNPASAARPHGQPARATPSAHAHPATGARRPTHAHKADAEEGFELFRRAILLRDDSAWLDISLRYRPMLISWAAQLNAHGSTDEWCDDIADRAFARAWSALSAERFARFPNLAALLGYLRACVSATTIDTARSQQARERAYQRLEHGEVCTPEELVLDRLERADLWRTAVEELPSERERVVLIESYLLELAPREILARHPELFENVREIYLAKRHLLHQLQRSELVRGFVEEVTN